MLWVDSLRCCYGCRAGLLRNFPDNSCALTLVCLRTAQLLAVQLLHPVLLLCPL